MKVFIELLSFIGVIKTRCLSLNNEIFLIRPISIDYNPPALNCYQFIIKKSGSMESSCSCLFICKNISR